jgi:hypothetical protein
MQFKETSDRTRNSNCRTRKLLIEVNNLLNMGMDTNAQKIIVKTYT